MSLKKQDGRQRRGSVFAAVGTICMHRRTSSGTEVHNQVRLSTPQLPEPTCIQSYVTVLLSGYERVDTDIGVL